VTATMKELRRLHEVLSEEIEEADALMDFVDNLEMLSAALTMRCFPKRAERGLSLERVLRLLAKRALKKRLRFWQRIGILAHEPLSTLADAVEEVMSEIRAADYGGWLEDDEDLVIEAEELRGQVAEWLEEFIEEEAQ
jgi:hypothetical protein